MACASLRRAFAAGALVTLVSAPAFADEAANKACGESFEKAQYLRKDNKLKGAREQALLCAREVCPSFVRDECTKMLSDIDSAQPTVVLAARDAKGADLVDVAVEVDGHPLAGRLEGTATPMDPGEHTLHFSHADQPAIDQHVVIRVGEKNRVISVEFAASPSGGSTKGSVSPAIERGKVRGPIWPAIVVGVVGLGAVGTSIGLGVDAKGTADNLRNTCAPRCPHGDVSAVNTELIVSDVLLVTGIVAAGVATWLFIARPGGHEAPAAAAFSVAPMHDGLAASLRLTF